MDYCITPEFEVIIGASRLKELNNHSSTVYGLDSELKISYLNPAWFQFSNENGNNIFETNAWSLGRNIFDCIPEVLEPLYKKMLESTLAESKSPLISAQSKYECSSPEIYRCFSMHLYSMGENGILVVHSLLVEEPHSIQPVEGMIVLNEEEYIDSAGVVTQCANCRRIKNLKHAERWDWIPKWITEPLTNTSHGICSPCRHHYYPSNKNS